MSFKTLDEAKKALLNRNVRGILLDTFVAGSSEELQASESFRVSKIIERSTGYGLVLSGDTVILKGVVMDYLSKHKGMLSSVIGSNAHALKVRRTAEWYSAIYAL